MNEELPKTLWQWAGVTGLESLNPITTALILIDFQRDYFDPHKLQIPDGEAAVDRAAVLLEWSRRMGINVIYVKHVSHNPKAPLFAIGSEGVKLHWKLEPNAKETVVEKPLPNSFDGTDLNSILKTHRLETIILAGLMTHMCVESTVRGALPLGYRVIVAADACASRDLPSWDGTENLGHTKVHEHALAALADRFAYVMTSENIRNLDIMAQGD
jgi:nicotinamidase-related amidase